MSRPFLPYGDATDPLEASSASGAQIAAARPGRTRDTKNSHPAPTKPCLPAPLVLPPGATGIANPLANLPAKPPFYSAGDRRKSTAPAGHPTGDARKAPAPVGHPHDAYDEQRTRKVSAEEAAAIHSVEPLGKRAKQFHSASAI